MYSMVCQKVCLYPTLKDDEQTDNLYVVELH